MKKFLLLILNFFTLSFLFATADLSYRVEKQFSKPAYYPKALRKFMLCYPNVEYKARYDMRIQDWEIYFTANIFENRPDQKYNARKHATLYWANGRLLPENELKNQENYWPLQYKYNRLKDPSTLTAEEIEKITEFGSTENRKKQAGSPMYFFDFLYAARSRIIIEDHIVKTTFLGKKTKIHERILPQLKKVEKEIYDSAKTDKEIQTLLDSLKSTDAYHWREIRDTSRKSFHSYGIAIDVLPKKLNGKAIYWSWERDRRGNKWMLTPLKERWTPGEKIIKIFERHGFIWGGNWIIFDNMHFEYHPELLQQ